MDNMAEHEQRKQGAASLKAAAPKFGDESWSRKSSDSKVRRRLRGDHEADTDTHTDSCGGWVGIGYDESQTLMARMSVVLGAYGKAEMSHALFFRLRNRVDDPLSAIGGALCCARRVARAVPRVPARSAAARCTWTRRSPCSRCCATWPRRAK